MVTTHIYSSATYFSQAYPQQDVEGLSTAYFFLATMFLFIPDTNKDKILPSHGQNFWTSQQVPTLFFELF